MTLKPTQWIKPKHLVTVALLTFQSQLWYYIVISMLENYKVGGTTESKDWDLKHMLQNIVGKSFHLTGQMKDTYR
jgi:hypothetical protein